jgi:hypothetical protein
MLLFWAVIGVQLASGHDPALTRDAHLQAERAAELAAQSAPPVNAGAAAPAVSGPPNASPTPVLTRPS